MAYADLAAYEADQDRVEHDPEMIAMLARFRAVVGGPAEVRRMKPVSEWPTPADAGVEAAAFNDGPAIAALLAEASLPVPDADDAPVRDGGDPRGRARDRLRRLGAARSSRPPAVGRGARGGPRAGRSGWRWCARRWHRSPSRGRGRSLLLTNDAEPFFAKLGFARVERAALPEAVRASRQVTTACCARAVAMSLSLG